MKNVGSITGKGRELVDMIKKRKVCPGDQVER